MKRRRDRGSSIIEFSLMTPWLIFMFIAAMDWGFYAYALIATESAARVACLYTASSAGTAGDSSTACTYALGQLQRMSNVASGVTTCSAAPVTVTAAAITGVDGNPASQVTVVYVTPVYIPMMGQIPKQLTITKIVQMRIGS